MAVCCSAACWPSVELNDFQPHPRSRLEESPGNWKAALDLLDAAERRYRPNPVPNLRPVAARKAQVSLWQGNLLDATAWVAACGVTATASLGLRAARRLLPEAGISAFWSDRDRNAPDLPLTCSTRVNEP